MDFSFYEVVDCRDSGEISECVKIDTYDSFERVVIMHICERIKINGDTVFRNSVFVPHNHKSGKTRITVFKDMYVICNTTKIEIFAFDNTVRCILQSSDNSKIYTAPRDITIGQRLFVEAQRRSEILSKIMLLAILYWLMVRFARYISNRLYS